MLFELAKIFADEFSQDITPPTSVPEHLIPIVPPHSPHSFDDNFPLYEPATEFTGRRRYSLEASQKAGQFVPSLRS